MYSFPFCRTAVSYTNCRNAKIQKLTNMQRLFLLDRHWKTMQLDKFIFKRNTSNISSKYATLNHLLCPRITFTHSAEKRKLQSQRFNYSNTVFLSKKSSTKDLSSILKQEARRFLSEENTNKPGLIFALLNNAKSTLNPTRKNYHASRLANLAKPEMKKLAGIYI